MIKCIGCGNENIDTAVIGGRVDEVRARMVSVLARASIAVLVLIWTATFLDSTSGWFAFMFCSAAMTQYSTVVSRSCF
jgi:hypothetical protein